MSWVRTVGCARKRMLSFQANKELVWVWRMFGFFFFFLNCGLFGSLGHPSTRRVSQTVTAGCVGGLFPGRTCDCRHAR